MLIIGLIKENILAVAALGCPVLEDAFFVDTVLGTKPLPEDRPHCKIESNAMSTMVQTALSSRLLWLPHWPICTVTISRGMLIGM